MLRRTQEVPLNVHLHDKQFKAFTSPANEILYGGAAGGGKSFLMRAAAIIWCAELAGLQVYLFRRIHEDLIKNHMEGPAGFRSLLAPWVDAGFVKIIENEIRFWNGSKIFLCHCQHEKDRYKYQGAEIHVLLMDELTHFTEVIYRFLRNRVRAVGLNLPEKYRGIFPRIVCGANPGNIGHQWVKSSFVDGVDNLAIRQMSKGEGGMRRQFIRAQLEDNPSMLKDDPEYEARLEGLGSEAQVKAMRWGDWDIVEGAFFDNFDVRRHVLRPVELPEHWMRFRAGDWGSARPFSFGWYAVASDDWQHPDGPIVPRGAMVRYREWYGVKTAQDGTIEPNVGVKMTAEQVAAGIKERTGDERIDYGVLDPGAFQVISGPSIGETFFRAGVPFRQADNRRVAARGALGGWDQVRARLDGNEDGNPMLFFFANNKHALRTIPVLQHDDTRVEDVMTESEDHAGDEVRYACMSRPWVKPAPKTHEQRLPKNAQTLDDLHKFYERKNRSLD
jgi:hypothetical protein